MGCKRFCDDWRQGALGSFCGFEFRASLVCWRKRARARQIAKEADPPIYAVVQPSIQG